MRDLSSMLYSTPMFQPQALSSPLISPLPSSPDVAAAIAFDVTEPSGMPAWAPVRSSNPE